MILVFFSLVMSAGAKKEDKAEIRVPQPKGNLRYSITVTRFENKANWRGQFDVGHGFSEMLTDALKQSDWFVVLGEQEMRIEAMQEQDFVDSGRVARGKKAPKKGRLTPAELLVKGAITHVQHSTTGGSGGIGFKGFRIGGKTDHAEINMTLYLVDSETGQVKASTNVIGKSGRKGLGIGYHGNKLSGLTGDLAGFKKDNVGKACQDAVDQAVVFLINQLEDISWQGTILLVKDDKIIMNRGSREGVAPGDRFEVGGVEELVDPDTGEVLDVDLTTAGIVEAEQVKEKITYLKPLEGCGEIKKDMTARPIYNKKPKTQTDKQD